MKTKCSATCFDDLVFRVLRTTNLLNPVECILVTVILTLIHVFQVSLLPENNRIRNNRVVNNLVSSLLPIYGLASNLPANEKNLKCTSNVILVFL